MPYSKSVVFNEQQDQFLEQILQGYRNTAGYGNYEQTSCVASQILLILETATEFDVT